MTNSVWVLPEGHNYSVEFYADGKWNRRLEFGTLDFMKQVARSLLRTGGAVRVVLVSRYDPHPAVSVVFYMEEP